MHTFAQKSKATQQTASAKPTIPGRAHFGQSREENSSLHLRNTTGDQAGQQILQANSEELEVGLTGTASPRFGHDSSRIPIHLPAAGVIQTKLAINKPGDEYEREADRISEQVMRMPESPLQPACACGGGCPGCQTTQLSRKQERSQTEHLRANNASVVESTPGIAEIIHSPGHPLDAETKVLMEPRFGRDFSQVRIHTDSQATGSARALNARAYTVGHNIVFGAGQYAPHAPSGKRLLAHELSHVLQQNRGGSAANLIQRAGPIAALGLGAAEWIALGTLGYELAQGVTQPAGDISFTFDDMKGVLLPGGGTDVVAYHAEHPDSVIQSKEIAVATWMWDRAALRAMGIKFGITFNYDGHAIGSISCRILDTYDMPGWKGSVNVNFTPLALSKGDLAIVRITLNLSAKILIYGSYAQSRILELAADGTIRALGRGDSASQWSVSSHEAPVTFDEEPYQQGYL